MIIDYVAIPHDEQRYESAGDWKFCPPGSRHENCGFGWYDDDHADDVLHIRVSKLSDPRHELLIFHHELTEAILCRQAGVTAEAVDEWDLAYEKCREAVLEKKEPYTFRCGCQVTETSEPGDDEHCPYRAMHQTATQCERLMAQALGVDWDTYNSEIESL